MKFIVNYVILFSIFSIITGKHLKKEKQVLNLSRSNSISQDYGKLHRFSSLNRNEKAPIIQQKATIAGGKGTLPPKEPLLEVDNITPIVAEKAIITGGNDTVPPQVPTIETDQVNPIVAQKATITGGRATLPPQSHVNLGINYLKKLKLDQSTARNFCSTGCDKSESVFTWKAKDGKLKNLFTCKSKSLDKFQNKLCHLVCGWDRVGMCKVYRSRINFSISDSALLKYGLKRIN